MPAPADASQPHAMRDDALAVVRVLRDAGHVAYFAGGCVRDQLLGLTPTDYDVATDAPPDRVRQLFSNTQSVGAAFGVILVRRRRSVIEVATFRTDLKYVDGRRPRGVVFTTAEEDARRRDFTINGLFYDPLDDRVIDYVGGQQDLQHKLLRAIGNADDRFSEDYLRLLRAVRFAARFDLQIEESTSRAMEQGEPRLHAISPERTAEELRGMLTPPTRAAAWALLRRYHYLRAIFRRPGEPATAAADEGAWNIFNQTSPGHAIPFPLALAAASLEHLLGRGEDVRTLCTRPTVQQISHTLRRNLKISNDEKEALEEILTGVGLMLAEPFPSVAQLKRFLARPTAAPTRELLGALSRAGLHRERVERIERALAEWENTPFAPPPLVTGDDLTAAGMQPGPLFKRVLDAVYDAQLEDRVATREQAIALALQLATAER